MTIRKEFEKLASEQARSPTPISQLSADIRRITHDPYPDFEMPPRLPDMGFALAQAVAIPHTSKLPEQRSPHYVYPIRRMTPRERWSPIAARVAKITGWVSLGLYTDYVLYKAARTLYENRDNITMLMERASDNVMLASLSVLSGVVVAMHLPVGMLIGVHLGMLNICLTMPVLTLWLLVCRHLLGV